MEGRLLNILEEYFSTIEKTGYIHIEEAERLILISFITDLINVPYAIMSSDQEHCLKQLLDKLYGCSCLANNFIFGKCCCKD